MPVPPLIGAATRAGGPRRDTPAGGAPCGPDCSRRSAPDRASHAARYSACHPLSYTPPFSSIRRLAMWSPPRCRDTRRQPRVSNHASQGLPVWHVVKITGMNSTSVALMMDQKSHSRTIYQLAIHCTQERQTIYGIYVCWLFLLCE